MSILVSCKCGKAVRVKDELAGKRVKCPGCALVLTVPAAETARADEVASAAKVATKKAPAKPVLAAPPIGPADKSKQNGQPKREAAPEAAKPTKKPAAESARSSWVNGSDLVALSDTTLYVTYLDEEKMQQARESLDAGESPDDVLAEADTTIPLDIVTKLEGNLHHAFFDVKYRPGEATEDSEKTIHCEDQAARDEVVHAIQDRLGPDWEKKEVEHSRLRASFEPLVVIVLFGFVTFCFFMVGSGEDKSSGGPKYVRTNAIGAMLVWVYNLLGPWAIVGIGGLIVALGVWWLVARVAKPPIMFTVAVPQPSEKRKRRP